jgi:hypothetical protein
LCVYFASYQEKEKNKITQNIKKKERNKGKETERQETKQRIRTAEI